jgi:hypothetical protein
MRRRLRQQQRVREALLLDLGALVYELHRLGRRAPQLLQTKAAEVAAVDREVRALADAVGARAKLQLVAPGVAGSCPSCGALLLTDARFCSRCGAAVGSGTTEHRQRSEPAARPDVARNGAGDWRPEESMQAEADLAMEQHAALAARRESANGEAGEGAGGGSIDYGAEPGTERRGRWWGRRGGG